MPLQRVIVASLLLCACRPELERHPARPVIRIVDPARMAATLARKGAPRRVIETALRAYDCAGRRGLIVGRELLLIDYTRPSTRRRLWLIDVEKQRTLLRAHVAHGRGSGEFRARRFSNEPGSNASSVGLYRVEERYRGRHGLARRLRGLEPGFNDNARRRAIVLHGAAYARPVTILRLGRLGLSLGCPAVSPQVARQLVTSLPVGTALLMYGNDRRWLDDSELIACGNERDRLADE